MEDRYDSRRKTQMNTQTVNLVVSICTLLIGGLVIVLILRSLVKFSRSRETKQFTQGVIATITQIKVEASAMSSWWVVIALWSDPLSEQTLIFRSSHLKYPPKQHVGEHIVVKLNPNQPEHYHMEL
jgi:hypothetical protein